MYEANSRVKGHTKRPHERQDESEVNVVQGHRGPVAKERQAKQAEESPEPADVECKLNPCVICAHPKKSASVLSPDRAFQLPNQQV